jgi:hypothetical protein
MSISCLLHMEISSSGVLDLQTDIRKKLVTYAIFEFLVPYSNYICHDSMVSGVNWKNTVTIQILVVPVFLNMLI